MIRSMLKQLKLSFNRATPPYPHLTGGERVLAEAALAGETAVLTDRRLVIGEANEVYYTDDHYESFRELVLG